MIRQILKDHYEQIQDLFDKYDIQACRIFGSVASATDHETSDIDMIMKFSDDHSLLDFGRLKACLERLLGRPLDILTYNGLPDKVLEHFKVHSLTIEEIIHGRTLEPSPADKVKLNIQSALWVIDRISTAIEGKGKVELLSDQVMKDAVTRNVQLLGQVLKQMPKETFDSQMQLTIEGLICLKEALYMNVDDDLLWLLIKRDLLDFRDNLSLRLE